MNYLKFCLGFFIGNCIPILILGLIAIVLAKEEKPFQTPLFIGVGVEMFDSLGRLVIEGFSEYALTATLINFLLLYIAYWICQRESTK